MDIKSSEITSESAYRNRREIISAFGKGALGLSALNVLSPAAYAQSAVSDPVTPYKDATHYNNFYEFTTDKEDVAGMAQPFVTTPWALRIEGLVKKPMTLSFDAVRALGAQEDRVYRLRCVEGWSMVIPWRGFSLAKLIAKAQPLGSAKYVQFISAADRKTMPGVRSNILQWPYSEGLRLDEAMHPLTLLAFGMYGQELPKQNGAPLRIVVPWKYGFKSAKSIVALRFTETRPDTAWNLSAPQEYGFYSNVNPDVPHPRWSQSTERRIGESGGLFAKRHKTLLFNGYADQVASLYSGMDLRKNF